MDTPPMVITLSNPSTGVCAVLSKDGTGLDYIACDLNRAMKFCIIPRHRSRFSDERGDFYLSTPDRKFYLECIGQVKVKEKTGYRLGFVHNPSQIWRWSSHKDYPTDNLTSKVPVTLTCGDPGEDPPSEPIWDISTIEKIWWNAATIEEMQQDFKKIRQDIDKMLKSFNSESTSGNQIMRTQFVIKKGSDKEVFGVEIGNGNLIRVLPETNPSKSIPPLMYEIDVSILSDKWFGIDGHAWISTLVRSGSSTLYCQAIGLTNQEGTVGKNRKHHIIAGFEDLNRKYSKRATMTFKSTVNLFSDKRLKEIGDVTIQIMKSYGIYSLITNNCRAFVNIFLTLLLGEDLKYCWILLGLSAGSVKTGNFYACNYLGSGIAFEIFEQGILGSSQKPFCIKSGMKCNLVAGVRNILIPNYCEYSDRMIDRMKGKVEGWNLEYELLKRLEPNKDYELLYSGRMLANPGMRDRLTEH